MILSAATLAIASLVSVGVQAAPPAPPPESGARSPECVQAAPVDSPCRGILVPRVEALRALSCVRVDLPECEQLAAIREAEFEAELVAERERTAAAIERAEGLRQLLEEVSSVPRLEKSSEPWRALAVVAGGVLAASGAVVAGLEHGREEVLVPALVIGSAGLALVVAGAVGF